jgi:hypothetical protein
LELNGILHKNTAGLKYYHYSIRLNKAKNLKMKKILIFICFLSILNSCKNASSVSPKAAVAAFIEASKTGNIAEIKKHITQSDAGLLDIGQSFLAKLDSGKANEIQDKIAKELKDKTKDAKIEIKDEKIDGDNATVNVEFLLNGKTEIRPFSLVKEDGLWKVSLISTGMNNAGVNQKDALEQMKGMDMDSIKNAVDKGMEEFNKIDKDSLNKVMKDAMKELDKLKEIPKEK